jgi:hypothetical protein
MAGVIRSPPVKCDRSDPKTHTGPFKLLRVEADGLKVIRCNACGIVVYLYTRKASSKPGQSGVSDLPRVRTK